MFSHTNLIKEVVQRYDYKCPECGTIVPLGWYHSCSADRLNAALGALKHIADKEVWEKNNICVHEYAADTLEKLVGDKK
jgi:DNA primase large subunit